MPEGIITALEIQKRNKERVNVYIDGEFAFGLSLIEAAKLRKGQQLSAQEIALLREDDGVQQAVDRAARFLAHRPRSVQEVRRNLKEKDVPPAVIDAALSRLETMGYVDDRTFARFWVQNRSEFKPLSARALRFELHQKGVANGIIDEILNDFDKDDAAFRAANSQVRRLRGKTRQEFRDKLFGFLQRRGFAYDTARTVIERITEALETEEPNYFDEGEM